MDILRTGAAWLHQQRASFMASPVEYLRRGAAEALEINATVGQTDSDQLIDAEFVATASVRDWIMAAADFFVAGDFVQPIPGDRITDVSTGSVWEVAELGTDRCWRYSDEFSNAVRVHSKLISVGSDGSH